MSGRKKADMPAIVGNAWAHDRPWYIVVDKTTGRPSALFEGASAVFARRTQARKLRAIDPKRLGIVRARLRVGEVVE